MTVVLHLLSISHGIAASLACFLVLRLSGVALLPRTWPARPLQSGLSATVGVAAYLLFCWFGIQANVRLGSLTAAFALATLVLAFARRGPTLELVRAAVSRAGMWWIALFAILYTEAYLFTLPPISARQLPLAWLGNVDVLQYLVFTKHLQWLGIPTLDGYSSHTYVYYQTPGAFQLLGGYSVLFGADPLRAAMPAVFALIALGGLVGVFVSREVFRLPPVVAATVGLVTASGPFLRFIAGHYYLSTLLAIPVAVHLLFVTAASPDVCPAHGFAPRRRAVAFLAVSFFAHDVVLLFTYPYMLAVTLVLQAAVIGLGVAAAVQDGAPFPETLWQAAVPGASAFLAFVALCLVLPARLAWVASMLRDLSQTGRWGWPLDIISPLALFGLPLPMNRLGMATPAVRSLTVAALWLVGGGSLILFAPRLRRWTTRGERVLLGACGIGFLLYAAYFALVGPSYQQWKLASYAALPLGFGVVAFGLRLIRPARAAAALGVLIVVANAAVHVVADQGFRALPGGWSNLAALNGDPSFRKLSLETSDWSVPLLAAYFLPAKRLSVWNSPPAPEVGARYAEVSRAQPLLVPSFSCEGVGHDDTRTIEGVGCLIFEPPSLVLDAEYGFNRTFMFVEPVGLGRREDWGRWNTRPVVALRLTADQRRIRLDDAAWLNVEVQRRRDDAREAPIRVTWGAGRRGEVVLGEREWISLPLRVGDWAGERVATQTVSLALPATVGFLGLSVTTSRRGRTVSPVR